MVTFPLSEDGRRFPWPRRSAYRCLDGRPGRQPRRSHPQPFDAVLTLGRAYHPAPWRISGVTVLTWQCRESVKVPKSLPTALHTVCRVSVKVPLLLGEGGNSSARLIGEPGVHQPGPPS